MAKRVQFDDEARQSLWHGVDQLAEAVRITLGPRGRGVVIAPLDGAPAITRDGIAVAAEVELADPFANLGVRLLRDAALRTAELAGDGTSTTTVLAHRLLDVRGVAEDAQEHIGLREFLARELEFNGAVAHEALRIVLVENREVRFIAQQMRVTAQHTVGHVMERAAPEPADGIANEVRRALEHFVRGLVREGHQQDAARLDAALDEPRDAVGERTRLARARGGNDEHGPVRRHHGGELFGIQGVFKIEGHGKNL